MLYLMLILYTLIIKIISKENTKSERPQSNQHFNVSFIFTRECNETSIAGGQKALAHSLTRVTPWLVKYFIDGNYNVPYYNAADQCIRLSPW